MYKTMLVLWSGTLMRFSVHFTAQQYFTSGLPLLSSWWPGIFHEVTLDSSVCRVIHNHFKCGFLCRLLPLYFPRDAYEEQVAATKLPTDVGDENGETVISERKIRISALPASSPVSTAPLLDDVTSPHHSMPSNRWVHHYFRWWFQAWFLHCSSPGLWGKEHSQIDRFQ